MSADDAGMPCYDCERRFRRSALSMREVVVDREDEAGYDMVPVPLCPECIGRRYGYDCPQCGLTHDDKESAEYCCRRRPGEAPDCPGCGRRMRVGSGGYSPATGSTVDWAECECCPIAWGSWTGWHRLDDDKCEHMDTVDVRLRPVGESP